MSGSWTGVLASYIARQLPHASNVHVRPAGPLPAGASNATVAFDASIECDGETIVVPLIVRPERQAGILAPYDIARQFTIMRALSRSDVPVPAVAWLEPGTSTLGAPFYIMGRLLGVRTPSLFWYGPSPSLDSAARALAAVHAADWQAIGLGTLLPPGATSPLDSEMAEWRKRAALSGADRVPLLARLTEQLHAHEPSDARFCLTHGDTNAGNYLFRGETVAAVVDWELSAIGDPRSDLGFYAALHTVFGGGYGIDDAPLTRAYEAVTGSALSNLEYYEAWGLYRMLMIFGGARGWFHPYGTEAALQRLDEILGRSWRAP